MRIQVTREYAGVRTKERRIYPGVYDLEDAALFNVGQYLLDNGFAVAVTEGHESQLSTDDSGDFIDTYSDASAYVHETLSHEEAMAALGRDMPPDDSDTADDLLPVYEEMTVDELREECELRGIDLNEIEGSGANGNLLKADLITILEGDDLDEGA